LQKACCLDNSGRAKTTQQRSWRREQESVSHHRASVGIVPAFNASDKHLCSSVTRELEKRHTVLFSGGDVQVVCGETA